MIRDLLALCRSIGIYRLRPGHQATLRKLYEPLVKPGQLVFDVGAHAGDRTACFNGLGARVVSVEPQPLFARFLALVNQRHDRVTVLRGVVSSKPGRHVLHVNSRNPTVSTLSDDFVAAAGHDHDNWDGQQWDRQLEVDAFTLDLLIKQHGTPDFIKIDVEGAEYEVLRGLSQPVGALSFEFTLIQRALAHDCLDRCHALGLTEFNVSLGETHQFQFGQWQDIGAVKALIDQLPASANSGDVYARLPR